MLELSHHVSIPVSGLYLTMTDSKNNLYVNRCFFMEGAAAIFPPSIPPTLVCMLVS